VPTNNETVAAVEEQPTAAIEPDGNEADSSDKEAIYEKIAAWVKEKTSQRIGKSGGRVIFDMVVDNVFAAAAKSGTFRFNGGFGSLHVRTYSAGSRRLPSGQETTFGEREKLRYEQGVVVTALVENKGNLEEAYKARGSRVKEVEGEAAPTTPAPSKAKVSPVTKVATPSKSATPKPAVVPKPAAAQATAPAEGAGSDGEIDLE
jgi:hypothetical protein